MANFTHSRTTALCTAGFAFAGLAVAPARAQFMAPMRMVVVPPPQAQTVAVPKKPNQQPAQATEPSPSDASGPADPNCRLQGRTRVCN
jgi:hypothetical protein